MEQLTGGQLPVEVAQLRLLGILALEGNHQVLDAADRRAGPAVFLQKGGGAV